MKDTLLTGWNLMRGLRLFMGIYIVIASITGKNYIFVAIGVLFVFQALTNSGCGACAAIPSPKAELIDAENIEFNEIKPEK